MPVENDPTSFLWRMVLIGFITVFVGAVPFVAFTGILGRGTGAEAAETGAIVTFVLVCLALFMLAPMYVVWSIFFLVLRNTIPSVRQRAMFSTGISIVIGNALIFALMLRGSSPDSRTSAEMGALALYITLIGVGLTWWAFRNEVQR